MNALRTSTKGFFRYTHEAGYCRANPARLVRRAVCGDAPPRFLSEKDQRRLLAVLAKAEGFEADRDSALFRVLLGTGVRIGSALALRIEDIDFERGEMLLRRMKGDRIEKIYLGRVIRDRLVAFVRGRRAGPLFSGRGGGALSARHVQRRLAMWCARAGIRRRVSPHMLRHSFATNLYRRTNDILLVKEALRHRSVTSTLVYASLDAARLRSALNA